MTRGRSRSLSGHRILPIGCIRMHDDDDAPADGMRGVVRSQVSRRYVCEEEKERMCQRL